MAKTISVYLGARINTDLGLVSLPAERAAVNKLRLRPALTQVYIPAGSCLRIVVTMVSTVPIVKWAQWRSRIFLMWCLQQWTLENLKALNFKDSSNESQPSMVDDRLQPEVCLFSPSHNMNRTFHRYQQAQTGYHLPRPSGAGVQHPGAVLKALLFFQDLLLGKSVLVKIMSAVAYIKRHPQLHLI